MKKNKNSSPDDLESFFKDKLEHGRMEPSPGLWDKIESELEEEKKSALLFPGLGALILIALGISVGVYFYGSKIKDAKKDQILAERRSQQEAVAAEQITQASSPIEQQPSVSSGKEQELVSQEYVSQEKTDVPITSEKRNPKSETKSSETHLLTSKNLNSETINPSPLTSAEEENTKNVNSNAVSGIAPTRIQVKTESSSVTGEKEKSNTVGKALPVLGSVTSKAKVKSDVKENPILVEGIATDNTAVKMDQVNSDSENKSENAINEKVADNSDKKETNKENVTVENTNKPEEPVSSGAVRPDSLSEDENYGKMALSVGIGFNQVQPSSFTNMPAGIRETWFTGFGDEFKFQYRFHKLISFNIGVGYSFYKMSRDATSFEFDRHSTGDYVFNTSVGNINVNYNTLQQGYDSNSGDKIQAKYTYASQLDFLNLPIEAQIHFVNKPRFRMWSGLGGNFSYALSQNTRFSLIKDAGTQSFNYTEVYIQKANAGLTLSLGCDIKFRDKMFIYISPSYRYGLTNLVPGTGITFKPQALMGVVGIKFIIK
jgi:hypothetical protein